MSAILPAIRSALQPAISGVYGSSSAWSPLTLFAASEVGVWYDPSDLSTMFQDVAGTVPVTADGDLVARINDKSGNGNHATQATEASRPLYKTSGGLHWLQFDGTDDFLQTAAIDFSATDEVTHFAGWTQNLSAFGVVTEFSSNPSVSAGTFAMSAYTSKNMFYVVRGSAALTATFDPAATIPKTRVSTGLLDIGQALAADEITARVNGVAKTATGYLDAGPAGTGNFGNYQLFIGRRGGVQYPFYGYIYSLVIRDKVSSAAEISSAESYIAGKSGVTL